MSLLTSWTRRDRKTADRRRKTFAPTFHMSVEDLESRTVLSAAAASAVAAQVAPLAKPTIQSVVQLTNLQVTNITQSGNQLLAQVTATLNIAGQTVTRVVNNVPVNLTASNNPNDADCPILHLSLGPVNLNLLGLNVSLDDCNGGPVTVDVTAHEGGGLLGDLLCGVANLLNGGTPLGDILGGLTTTDPTALLGGVTDLLNGVLNQQLGLPGGGAGGVTAAAAPTSSSTDILNLHIPQGIDLNVLGLEVQTSPICLDVTAQSGNGNLLGNLLSSLTNLLNNRGNNAGGQAALLKNITKVLGQL